MKCRIENEICIYLKKNFYYKPISRDKSLLHMMNYSENNSKKLRYRPDFVYKSFFRKKNPHYVILEVDEYGHRYYNKEKEFLRTKSINSFFDSYIVWVRYNPHGKNNKEILLKSLNKAMKSKYSYSMYI